MIKVITENDKKYVKAVFKICDFRRSKRMTEMQSYGGQGCGPGIET